MSAHHVPLGELARAVQNAVEQVLSKHGAVPVEKLWVGFVAPENIATRENASKLATELGRGAGMQVQPAVAQQVGGAAAGESHTAPEAALKPGHIIGLVFAPKTAE